MNALPILFLGGAALMLIGGGKGGRKKGTVTEQGQFESGEAWRIRHIESEGVYAVDINLDGKRWTTVKSSFYDAPMGYPSIEEAKEIVDKLSRTELLIDERGELSHG